MGLQLVCVFPLIVLGRLAMGGTGAVSDVGTVLYPLQVPAGISLFSVTSTAKGQAVGDIASPSTGSNDHAFLLTATGFTDLNPAGFTSSVATATDGSQQVGYGLNGHALLWSGTAASAIDLHDPAFVQTYALNVGGGQQVGYGNGSGTQHAIVWSGTAASAIDLNYGPRVDFSEAFATDGIHQVGYARFGGAGYHAVFWSGTAASLVDLNQSGDSFSQATGVGGGQEVGYGRNANTGATTPYLWTGTAASAVDLNPAGPVYQGAQALATNGKQQVGAASVGGNNNAVAWSGTADSISNLQLLLPASGIWTDSTATAIDANGNIFGTADGTYNGVSGEFAVEWSPVPEPASVGVIAALAIAGSCARSRCRRR